MVLNHAVHRVRALWGRRPAVSAPPLLANTHLAPGNQWYAPTLAGASTFAQAATDARTVRKALDVLTRLTPDAYASYVADFYTAGVERYRDSWRYADLNTVLVALAAALQPTNYLELGVRRGRSLAMVASQAPACHMVACDLFIDQYAGMENPGPRFVRAELERMGMTGRLDFLVGDSHIVVPDYFRRHPDLFFDMITVDGDHSARGAREDLLTVMPRVKIGGALIFDDVSNHSHPELRRVWGETVVARQGFSTFTYDEIGFGVGLAIRHA